MIANKIGQRQLPFLHGEFAEEVSLSLFHQYAEHYWFIFWYTYYISIHFTLYVVFKFYNQQIQQHLELFVIVLYVLTAFDEEFCPDKKEALESISL